MSANLPQVAVGGVCVRDGRLLVVRRGRGVALGRWSVPGGRLGAGESLAAAVIRELCEETGLEVVVGPLVGVAERVGEGHHFVILDYRVTAPPDAVAVAGDDAAEVRWADHGELDRLELVDGLLGFLAEHGVLGELSG
jgi:ADP-ribose pyrophosphatase YjhB (NUDIX family)